MNTLAVDTIWKRAQEKLGTQADYSFTAEEKAEKINNAIERLINLAEANWFRVSNYKLTSFGQRIDKTVYTVSSKLPTEFDNREYLFEIPENFYTAITYYGQNPADSDTRLHYVNTEIYTQNVGGVDNNIHLASTPESDSVWLDYRKLPELFEVPLYAGEFLAYLVADNLKDSFSVEPENEGGFYYNFNRARKNYKILIGNKTQKDIF